MAKMMNSNTVNAMTLVNAKAQSRAGQRMQKIGKSKRKVQVTLSKGVRAYLNAFIKENRKEYLKHPNIPQNIYMFFDYFEKETEINKGNKKIKEKDIMLSYEEIDYLKMSLKGMLTSIEEKRKTLKWYEFHKKLSASYTKKQSELTLEELGNTGKNKNKGKNK